jgi:hypothetical protein
MANTFILGAGFSVPAEFPSGQTLNQIFFKNLENNILKLSDEQWVWDEYDNSITQNGRLNTDYLNISFLLSELIETFQKETFLPFDYEEFFDWIHKDYDADLLKKSCNKVNKRLAVLDIPAYSGHLFKDPNINEYLRVQKCYSYLIADLLRRPYKRTENLKYYTRFIDSLKKDEKANIFTLNHDTLFEYLMQVNAISYSDGFSINNSMITNNEKEKMEVFNNDYNADIKLFKLHGSVDYYQFAEMKESDNGVYNYTGNYWFFKPKNYWDIHTASLIDPVTDQVIQSVNPDIKPQFLTGKSKAQMIDNHPIYKKLYSNLIDSLSTTNKLIIIGYSYRDKHINQLIKESLESRLLPIVNVNPYVRFPFRKNYSQNDIFELQNIDQLKCFT